MKSTFALGLVGAIILVAFALMLLPQLVADAEEKMAMPFGGKMDVAFAKNIWEGMEGYQEWLIQSDVIPGNTPHGAFIQYFYGVVSADGKPYHVIVKDNFMPDKKLAAITVMVQREAGYDPDNNDWFWVKYGADGAVAKNDGGMSLAGRVAKGMDMGCIACHKTAKDNDYVFFNDGMM